MTVGQLTGLSVFLLLSLLISILIIRFYAVGSRERLEFRPFTGLVLAAVCIFGVLVGLLCYRQVSPGVRYVDSRHNVRGFPFPWLRIDTEVGPRTSLSVLGGKLMVDVLYWLGTGTLLVLIGLFCRLKRQRVSSAWKRHP